MASQRKHVVRGPTCFSELSTSAISEKHREKQRKERKKQYKKKSTEIKIINNTLDCLRECREPNLDNLSL